MSVGIAKLALIVGVISMVLTLGQALSPVSDSVLLRALLIGQLLILLALALLAGVVRGESSNK